MPSALSHTSFRLLVAIRTVAVVIIAFHLAAPMLPEGVAWGVWPATYLIPPVRWLLAFLAGALVLFGDRVWQKAHIVRTTVGRISFTSPGVRLAFSLGAGVVFYFFRIRHLRWGDAELLVKALADPYRVTYVWQAPLDVFIHARSWQLGQALFGWTDPTPVYVILSTAAGIVFIWVLIGLAAILGHNRTERGLIVGSVLTLGTMLLFFGYIENYSFMTLGVLVYVFLALRYLRGENGLVFPAAALALTHAFHPSTIILTPSLLYLAAVSVRKTLGNVPGSHHVLKETAQHVNARVLASIVTPYVLVLAGVVALMSFGGHGLAALVGDDFPGGGDRSWFVPMFRITTEWQHYTMFSLGHLLDIVNQQLLVGPMIWPTLFLTAFLGRQRLPKWDATGLFLLLMAAFYLLLTLVWNADYGGQKDWDLFSPAAVPAALLLCWALPRVIPERHGLGAAGATVIAVQAFHLVAWIWQNTLPQ